MVWRCASAVRLSVGLLVLTALSAPTLLVQPAIANAQVVAQAPTTERPRIAVLDFELSSTGLTGNSWWYAWGEDGPAQGVSDLLINKLVQSGAYTVVERGRISEVLQEQNLAQGGRIDPSTAAQVGRLLGADVVVIGSITRFNLEESEGGGSLFGFGGDGNRQGAEVQLTARMVNTTTGEIISAVEGAGSAGRGGGGVSTPFGSIGGSDRSPDEILSDAAETAVTQVADQLVAESSTVAAQPQALPVVEALVADVAGGVVVINKGTQDGFRTGMTLSIERVAREVTDPATGEVIRTITTPVGQIELTEVDARSGVGRIVSGTGMQVGDRAIAVE